DENDDIVGISHLTDVLGQHTDPATPIEKIAQEPLVVAETVPLPLALRVMDKADQRLARVVDEYGGFAGILTIEDLAEEGVGDITDAHDPAPPPEIQEQGADVWLVSGDVHVDEMDRHIHLELPEGDYETIAGM